MLLPYFSPIYPFTGLYRGPQRGLPQKGCRKGLLEHIINKPIELSACYMTKELEQSTLNNLGLYRGSMSKNKSFFVFKCFCICYNLFKFQLFIIGLKHFLELSKHGRTWSPRPLIHYQKHFRESSKSLNSFEKCFYTSQLFVNPKNSKKWERRAPGNDEGSSANFFKISDMAPVSTRKYEMDFLVIWDFYLPTRS